MKTLLKRISLWNRTGRTAAIQEPGDRPHLHESQWRPEYLTLSEGLTRQLVSITEIHSAGTVPQVKVTNLAEALLLLVDGEELIGARQNRTLNTSILVAGKTELVVPVSCTEAGRWAYKRAAFADAGHVSPHKLRKAKSDSVTASLLRNLGHKSDQRAVWQAVDCLCASAGTKSPTRAMFDAMAAKAKELDDYLTDLGHCRAKRAWWLWVNGRLRAWMPFHRAGLPTAPCPARPELRDGCVAGGEAGGGRGAAASRCGRSSRPARPVRNRSTQPSAAAKTTVSEGRMYPARHWWLRAAWSI